MTDERNPYDVLGIPAAATPEQVTSAYRRMARRHHPDVSPDTGSEARMAEINTAWTLLRDPARRAAWDRGHGITSGDGRAGAGGSEHAGTPNGGAAWPNATGPARGRSTTWRRGPAGEGAAGPPPGSPRGSVLPFGRHIGWSLGEIARVDPGYLVWLEARREGEPYREEIGALLEAFRARTGGEPVPTRRRRGLFR